MLCVCVWLTQVRGQPGRFVLHSAGWPRSGSMDGGGSGVWQQVRGRTERAPLLLWIDTETQSMAHKALRPALNSNSPAFIPPCSLTHTQPMPPASSLHTHDRRVDEHRHAMPVRQARREGERGRCCRHMFRLRISKQTPHCPNQLLHSQPSTSRSRIPYIMWLLTYLMIDKSTQK